MLLSTPTNAISILSGPSRPLLPRLVPPILGIDGDLLVFIILIIIIVVLTIMIVRFLNQSIELAVQIEREMKLSQDLEDLSDDLTSEVETLKEKIRAMVIYAKEAKEQENQWVQSTTGDYGDVEVYQHYETLGPDVISSREVEVESQVEEETHEEVKVPKPKKKAPVIAKAKVLSIPTLSEWSKENEFIIQDVFIIYKDGRLVTHLSKKIRIIDDSEIIGSMIAAVQMAVRESFKRESKGTLDALRFSDLTVLMETGEYLNLAVVIRGRSYAKLKNIMTEVVTAIHEAWGDDIEAWDGARTNVSVLEKVIQRDLLDRFETETFHKSASKTMDLSQAKVFKPGK